MGRPLSVCIAPYYSAIPPASESGPKISASMVRRMASWGSRNKSGPIPLPTRPPTTQLNQVIDDARTEIESEGTIGFHAVGTPVVPTYRTWTKGGRHGGDGGRLLAHCGRQESGLHPPSRRCDLRAEQDRRIPRRSTAPTRTTRARSSRSRATTTARYSRRPTRRPLEAFSATSVHPRRAGPPVADQVRIFRETMTQPGSTTSYERPSSTSSPSTANIAEGPGKSSARTATPRRRTG